MIRPISLHRLQWDITVFVYLPDGRLACLSSIWNYLISRHAQITRITPSASKKILNAYKISLELGQTGNFQTRRPLTKNNWKQNIFLLLSSWNQYLQCGVNFSVRKSLF